MDLNGDSNDDGIIDNNTAIIRDNITLDYHAIGSYKEKTNLLILPSG